MYELSYLYFLGNGVKLDNKKGFHWLFKAADLGDPRAVQVLKWAEDE
jgi:TPR repeat protein